jgi:hypothetical protein
MIPSYVASRLHGEGRAGRRRRGRFRQSVDRRRTVLGMITAQLAAQTAREALRDRRTDAAFLARYAWRIKFSPILCRAENLPCPGCLQPNGIANEPENPLLGKIFKLYSTVGDIALRRL